MKKLNFKKFMATVLAVTMLVPSTLAYAEGVTQDSSDAVDLSDLEAISTETVGEAVTEDAALEEVTEEAVVAADEETEAADETSEAVVSDEETAAEEEDSDEALGATAATNTIWIVGDSTVSAFTDTYFYPRYGWGTQIDQYLSDDYYEVKNIAASGRSSKSYLVDNASDYANLTANIKAGDFLFIGFGHNDEKAEEARYANPNQDYTVSGSFANSLYENYVKVAKDAGATAVLCTPIVRINLSGTLTNSDKHITSTSGDYEGGDYRQAIIDLGSDTNTPVIDLTTATEEQFKELGVATDSDPTVKLNSAVYLHAWTSDKPSSVDKTHTNIWGAKWNAWYIMDQIKNSSDSAFATLSQHITTSTAPGVDSLYSNPDYVHTEYSAPTEYSVNWADYACNAGIFHGTVMGDVGGASKIGNFSLRSNKTNGNAYISAPLNGKIGSTDGFAMYFMQVPSDAIFTLTAKATVTNIVSGNSSPAQTGFGLMARDDMYIDVSDASILSDYVAAGTLTKTDAFYNCFKRKDSTLEAGGTLAATASSIAVGDTFDLLLAHSSDGFTCKFGDNPAVSAGFDFNLNSVDADNMYIGMFVARGIAVEFSDIELTGICQVNIKDENGNLLSQSVVETGEKVSEPSYTPTVAAGQLWDGWKAVDASGNSLGKFDFTKGLESSVTLVPNIGTIAHISYITNSTDSANVYTNAIVGDAIENITVKKNGYTFLGWDTVRTPSYSLVSAFDFTKGVTGDTVLYAKWGKADSNYDVTPTETANPATTPDGIYYDDYIYTGVKVTPEVEIYYAGNKLVEGKDYTVTYKNNLNAATCDKDVAAETGTPLVDVKKAPTMVIKYKGSYKGQKTVNFNICSMDLNDMYKYIGCDEGMNIFEPVAKSVYTKTGYKSQNLMPTIYAYSTSGFKALKANTDFTVNYTNGIPTSPRYDYPLTVTGSGNYCGTVEMNAVITNDVIKPEYVNFDDVAITAGLETLDDGSMMVEVEATYDGTELEESDFAVSTVYDSKNVYTFIKGEGKYVGGRYVVLKRGKVSYNLADEDQDVEITLDRSSYVDQDGVVHIDYVPGNNTPGVTVSYNGTTLKSGTDYTVKYTNMKTVTTSKPSYVEIKGKGSYSGTVKLEVSVDPVDFDDRAVIVVDNSKGDDASSIKVTVYDAVSGTKLKAGSDYNKEIGYEKEGDDYAFVTVTADGAKAGTYTGSATKAFGCGMTSISKAKVKINDVSYNGGEIILGKDSMTVTLADGTTLGKDDYYVNTFLSNTAKGKGIVILQGMDELGKYSGGLVATFKIKERDFGKN